MARSSVTNDADEVEFFAMFRGSANIDSGYVDEGMSGELDDAVAEEMSLNPDMEVWGLTSLKQDDLSVALVEEIKLRKAICAEYPFVLDGNTLTHIPSQTGVYEYCLVSSISTRSHINRKKFEEQGVDLATYRSGFEYLSSNIVRSMFSAHASSVRTGWPRIDKAKFFERFQRLVSNRTKPEWTFKDAGLYFTAHAKDASLDFIVTVSLGDERSGRLYILGQCACGDNWSAKLDEPNYKKLTAWFHPSAFVQPIRVLAVSRVLSESEISQASHGNEILVLDRLRIAALAKNSWTSSSTYGFRKLIRAWDLLTATYHQ